MYALIPNSVVSHASPENEDGLVTTLFSISGYSEQVHA